MNTRKIAYDLVDLYNNHLDIICDALSVQMGADMTALKEANQIAHEYVDSMVDEGCTPETIWDVLHGREEAFSATTVLIRTAKEMAEVDDEAWAEHQHLEYLKSLGEDVTPDDIKVIGGIECIDFHDEEEPVKEVIFRELMEEHKDELTVDDGIVHVPLNVDDIKWMSRNGVFHEMDTAENDFTPEEIEMYKQHLVDRRKAQGKDVSIDDIIVVGKSLFVRSN